MIKHFNNQHTGCPLPTRDSAPRRPPGPKVDGTVKDVVQMLTAIIGDLLAGRFGQPIPTGPPAPITPSMPLGTEPTPLTTTSPSPAPVPARASQTLGLSPPYYWFEFTSSPCSASNYYGLPASFAEPCLAGWSASTSSIVVCVSYTAAKFWSSSCFPHPDASLTLVPLSYSHPVPDFASQSDVLAPSLLQPEDFTSQSDTLAPSSSQPEDFAFQSNALAPSSSQPEDFTFQSDTIALSSSQPGALASQSDTLAPSDLYFTDMQAEMDLIDFSDFFRDDVLEVAVGRAQLSVL